MSLASTRTAGPLFFLALLTALSPIGGAVGQAKKLSKDEDSARIRKSEELRFSLTLAEGYEWAPADLDPNWKIQGPTAAFSMRKIAGNDARTNEYLVYSVYAYRWGSGIDTVWPVHQKYMSDQLDEVSKRETKDLKYKGERAVQMEVTGTFKNGGLKATWREIVFQRRGILYIVTVTVKAGEMPKREKEIKELDKLFVIK